MPSISREQLPGRSRLTPAAVAEYQDWQVLTGRLTSVQQALATLQAQVVTMAQQSYQRTWTIVQQATDYDFPAAFIRAEIDATGAARTATLPLSDNLQGQLANVVKSDSSVNAVSAAPTGTDALFVVAGDEDITTEWGGVVYIAVPGGWSIFARSV